MGIRYAGAGSSRSRRVSFPRDLGDTRLVALLVLSIGIVFAGFVCSLVLMVRSGESRVALLALCFALLAVRQGATLWLSRGVPLGFDAAGMAEVSMVVLCLVGLLILAALWRTLAERDRAEALHWDSMEAVRILGELAAQSNLSLDEKLDALLKIGCDRFDLEIGMISRVHRQRYEVIAIRAPEDFPVARGAVFMLAGCQQLMVTVQVPSQQFIVKADERLLKIPVIMLTARHYLEDEQMTAKHAGQFVSYVVKPFVVRELVQEVRKVLCP